MIFDELLVSPSSMSFINVCEQKGEFDIRSGVNFDLGGLYATHPLQLKDSSDDQTTMLQCTSNCHFH